MAVSRSVLVAVVLCGFFSAIAAQATAGIANLVGTTNDPTIRGRITFTPVAGNLVRMNVSVTGVTVRTGLTHGIHIHQFGDLTGGTGAAAGSHWNPYAQNHGCPEQTSNRHLGDTGNWQVDSDGNVYDYKDLDLIALSGNNSIIGFAVIFHQNTDDCSETTSSAARLAHGVVGVANPAAWGETQNDATAPSSYTPNNVKSAICNLQGLGIVEGIASGWVRFDQASPDAETVVTAKISGLPSGSIHGFHIHQWGDLTNSDGTSAGPHFTGPTLDAEQMHSIPGANQESHVGDMGNLYHYEDGIAYYKYSFGKFGLWGNDNNVVGRAVVLHELKDNCSQPYGAAGGRWAHCVIGAANSATIFNATDIPSGVSEDQDFSACPVDEDSSLAFLVVPSVVVVLSAVVASFFH
eukprot:TRINITY_DN377_c0_g1_i1.p1 TRINITY_DN377_c0_g1~~TRINITY_DN377_c0_g1_i1.p1  ORF type:complete len:407 (-),score=88.86 TRINITY_DN377_c0_g1_i1:78-1298(-)